MYNQAVIHFKNGTNDWIDPINDAAKDIRYIGDTVFINNGLYDYDFLMVDIDSIEIAAVPEIDDERSIL
jgi:hypothetical protein